jgi:hypothetical protein
MKRILKVLAIGTLFVLSCSMPTRIPQVAPALNKKICIEAFRHQDGMIYVVKSEMVPGEFYWDGATSTPKRKRVWMEVYASVGGRIELINVYEAKCIPAKPESWEWELNEKNKNEQKGNKHDF